MKIAVLGLGYVSADFCVSGVFPISYSNDRVFVLEYDCLLVNRRMSSGLEQEQAPVQHRCHRLVPKVTRDRAS
jgi:hypothetical protein